jgi:hypothetical protein
VIDSPAKQVSPFVHGALLVHAVLQVVSASVQVEPQREVGMETGCGELLKGAGTHGSVESCPKQEPFVHWELTVHAVLQVISASDQLVPQREVGIEA